MRRSFRIAFLLLLALRRGDGGQPTTPTTLPGTGDHSSGVTSTGMARSWFARRLQRHRLFHQSTSVGNFKTAGLDPAFRQQLSGRRCWLEIGCGQFEAVVVVYKTIDAAGELKAVEC
jgi:hypothetical protein